MNPVDKLNPEQVAEFFRQRHEALQAAFDAVPAGIIFADGSGKVLLVSSATDRFLGGPLTGDAHGPSGGYRLVLPDGSPMGKGQLPLSRALAGETVEEIEVLVIRADGSQTNILATAAPLKSDQGDVWGAVTVFQDITGRRRAAEDLRKAREDSMRFPDENPSPVARVSMEGKVLYLNPAARRHPSFRFEGDRLPAELSKLVESIFRQGRPVAHDVELAGRTFSISFAPVPEGSYVNLYTRDITDRKHAEEALSESESFYRQTLESIPGMAFTTRPDGYCDFQSQQWVEFTGVPMSEQLGEGWVKLLHPDDRPRAFVAWRAAVEGRAPYDQDYRIRGNDGSYEWFRSTAQPIRDGEGKIVRWFGMATNIDAIKRARDDLKKLNATLEQRVAERTSEVRQQADRLRALASELSSTELRERKRLATILHDHIQQLIVAARMRLERVKSDADRDQLQAAAHAAEIALGEALEASRSLTVDLSPPVLHESGLVGALNWLATGMQEKHQLKVILRLDSRAEPAAEAIRFLLFECARELLFNAVKHAGVSEVQLTLALAKDDELQLIVSDFGHGFDPLALEKRQPGELTFGLFSVQERLAYIGGHMLIETSPGEGTRVTLTAPIGVAETVADTPADVKGAGPAGLRIRCKTDFCRVLVVDDHKIVREGLVGLLQSESDIEVVGEAANGPRAIKLAEQLDPDVIVMDINLGSMSGIEATRIILAHNPGINVIGLSMHADESVASAMHEAGASRYLSKGGPSHELIAAIHACCVK